MPTPTLDPQLQGLGISPVSASLPRPANDHGYIWTAPEEPSSMPEGNGFGIAFALLGMFALLGLGLFAAAIGLIDILTGWSP